MLFPCGKSIKSFFQNVSSIKKINDTNTHYYCLGRKNPVENGIPPYNHSQFCRERAPYVTLHGSITVEASLVMPFVVLAFSVIIQVLLLMNVQLKVQGALFRQTMKAAGYSYFADSVESCIFEDIPEEDYKVVLDIAQKGVTALLIKNMVLDELGDDFFDNPWIKGGKDGISVLIMPWTESEDIDVALYYRLQPAYDFFGIGSIDMVSRARTGKWTGSTRVPVSEEEAADAGTVYITGSGTVYHTYRDCTYLSVRLTAVRYSDIGNKRNSSGGKYYPCSSCCTGPAEDCTVYISRYGERYHKDKSCHSIYHNIIEVTLDEVGSRQLCSKCRSRN